MPSYWLSASIWVPIFAGLIVLAAGDRNLREAKAIALLGAVAGFAVTVPLVTGFQTGTSAMQFVEIAPWIDVLMYFGDSVPRVGPTNMPE